MTREELQPSLFGSDAVVEPARYDRRASRRWGRVERVPFDPLTVSLEPGISLVEASAGTGKTFCIAQTVLRLLLEPDADGRHREIGRILVVTFTNKATDELITRVRARLREAVEVFAGKTMARTAATESLFALRDVHGEAGLPLLQRALRSLDSLSIFTIHGFCKRVLEESALESGTPYDATFLEEDALLVERAARDWWRRTMYEDDRLAALAVRAGWSFDAFVNDWKVWRRLPKVEIEPDESLERVRAELDRAMREFALAWDADRAARFFAERKWLSDSPVRTEGDQARVVRLGDALARGDAGAIVEVASICGSATLLDAKKGVFKRDPGRDAIASEPFVLAADRIAAVLVRLQGALRVSGIGTLQTGFEEEKRRRHLLGFDDLLRRLKDALEKQGAEGQLARAIRARYDAALIDEFQDTDPYQFPIFSTAFAGRPLFLIGDPKQAIYGFRGADLHAYIEATHAADREYTLGRNWRSTARMVHAVNLLFARRPDPFLHDEIPFVPATAARAVHDPLAHDIRGAMHWWFVPPEVDARSALPDFVGRTEAERRILWTLVREVVRLLKGGEGRAPLRAGQLAVLVRTGREGLAVQRELRAAGVPCVVAGLEDILQSREMRELEPLLRAVLAPQNARLVRAALATELWGMDAAAIHALALPEQEAEWLALVDRLDAARESWAARGFMRMIQELLHALGALDRLLARPDGERRVTNLRHAIELLHTVASEEKLTPEGLLLWIGRARATGSEDAERKELRLESDADAVQVTTMHKSKGLEFDVVFCPGLWSTRHPGTDEAVLVHEPDRRVVFDHGSPRHAERRALAVGERLAEDLRLAYVALTRARLRCYVGWGAIQNSDTKVGAAHSALGYLLREAHEPGDAATVAERTAAVMSASLAQWQETLARLVASSGGAMTMEVLDDDPGMTTWRGTAEAAMEPVCRELVPRGDQLTGGWRIASFTSLVAARHASVEALDDGRDVADHAAPAVQAPALSRDDIMAFPWGRAAGTALHELFERADFDAPPDALRALAAEVLVRHRLAEDEGDLRVDAVARMAATVLAAPLPGERFALRDVPRRRTLREWSFHLPLGRVGRETLATLFAAHGDEVARRYAPALRALAPRDVHGFLTGVVDLALEHEGRWFVVDWKSNHLGVDGASYEPAALEGEMAASHYLLQYHLYVVALHRFLRARLPGYDYDTHVGGAHYAFLRGIDGTHRGWFTHRPARALVDALDALMHEGAA